MNQTFFANEMPQIIRRVTELQAGGKCPVVIAIDGMAAAGKSALARLLSQALDGAVISMDDFPLPQGFRTPKRLKTPGGNVYYERFLQEAAPYLRCGELFGYRVFDAQTSSYTQIRLVPPKPVIIVEGSYSLHPAFGDLYDLRLFCQVSPFEQRQRIMQTRPKEADLFHAMWIPMETRYFEAFGIPDSCHMVLESGAPQPSAPLEIERKFLVAMPDGELLREKARRVIEIEQVYLTGGAPGVSVRIRKSEEQGTVTYHKNEKQRLTDRVRTEVETVIDQRHYEILRGFADPALRPIRKTRYCVPMGDLTAEIDLFPFWEHQGFCEVELPQPDTPVTLPDWLTVLREVTEDPRYTNLALAREIPQEDES